MDKKKIILGLLTVIAIFVWVRGLHTGSRSKAKFVMDKEEAFPSIDFQKRQKSRTSYEAWGRNPFTVTIGPSSESFELKLGGITYDAKGRCALINDKIVHVGEKVGDYRVIGINQDKVIVSDGAKDIELRLER
ncbi:MAG: hypothetical protein Q8Q87_03135 [Candidatus Omnitrophota bacterium]|nr:hypothetical protein [Candidatus Omnitrophota bacterium]